MGTMICNYCNSPAKLVSGKKIYPHRSDLKELLYWFCEPCNAYVRCHRNTNKPLGNLANLALRRQRIYLHQLFDCIWRNKEMKRKEAYQWLAVKLDIPFGKCHIGMFDMELCKRAKDILEIK